MRFLFFSTTPGVPGKAGDGISDGGMIKHHSTLNRSFDQSVCYNIKNYQTKKWIRHFSLCFSHFPLCYVIHTCCTYDVTLYVIFKIFLD